MVEVETGWVVVGFGSRRQWVVGYRFRRMEAVIAAVTVALGFHMMVFAVLLDSHNLVQAASSETRSSSLHPSRLALGGHVHPCLCLTG